MWYRLALALARVDQQMVGVPAEAGSRLERGSGEGGEQGQLAPFLKPSQENSRDAGELSIAS